MIIKIKYGKKINNRFIVTKRKLRARIERDKQKLADCQLTLIEIEQNIVKKQAKRDEIAQLLAESEARIQALEQALLVNQKQLSAEREREKNQRKRIIQDCFMEVFGQK
ncbi:MAG: hypothetical protein LBR43_01615 [Spiroplasmataceae bacterium]|jgi:hypothetical protein|nr:hypothetical protein [Spiroplasmataceae bacterium]